MITTHNTARVTDSRESGRTGLSLPLAGTGHWSPAAPFDGGCA